MFFIHNQWLLIISFIFIGINNLTMNTQPFTLLTEAIDGENSGAYLGLFNTSICLPQIVASVVSFALFPLLGSSMPAMLLFAGIMMLRVQSQLNLLTQNLNKILKIKFIYKKSEK